MHPELRFRYSVWEDNDLPLLSMDVYPVREVTLHGRVFSMSSINDCIVKASTFENNTVVERVGEILNLWEHKYHPPTGAALVHTFALIRWYKASPIFAPRSVRLWFDEL